MSSPLPLLAFHNYQSVRLSRTPILSPLLIVVTQGCNASACGYQSPSRFAAAFQRQFGCTPSALRQLSGAGEKLREAGALA